MAEEIDIYYPKDYNDIADIPSDLKKMAISIQKKINNIGNGGNTDINGIFFFDVTEANSATDPKRTTFFQKVVDYVRTGEIAYILSYYPSDKRPIICAIPSVSAGKSNDFLNLAPSTILKKLDSFTEITFLDYGITFDLDDDYNVIRGGFLGGIQHHNFLDPQQNYRTTYEPQFDSSPVTKKYVDNSISNSLSNISSLTPEIVESLPEVGNANKIYLVLNKEASTESNNIYNEYLFINGKYELFASTDTMNVNVDLSQYVKKEEVPLVYFWDGKSSTSNPDNVRLFQEILDEYLKR